MAHAARSFVIAVLLTAFRVTPCLADPSAEDRAAAQALFDEGRSLIKSGHAAEACSKFDESERLDPSIGTQLNLADCYERTGRTASAWTLYLELASAARKAGQSDRATLAGTRAQALEAKLSHLTIVVPDANQVPGLVVERGTSTVGRAQWGASIPVDPGPQLVKVSAPGKQPWQTTIEVASGTATETVTVPALTDAPATLSAGAAGVTGATDGGTPSRHRKPIQRTAAYVAGGVGVVGLVVGSVFGLRASSKKSDAHCDGNVCAGEPQKETYEQAQKAGTIATIAFAAGGAALAAGVVLYLTAPRDPEKPDAGFSAQASAGPTGVTLSAGARF